MVAAQDHHILGRRIVGRQNVDILIDRIGRSAIPRLFIQTLLRRRVRSQGVEGERPSRAKRLLTWTPYLVGVPIFMVALYVFFENFGRLLPGNY